MNQAFVDSTIMAGEDGPGTSLRNIAHTVCRWKWLVLGTFLCSVIAATAIVLRTLGEPVFLASSQILVSPGREQVLNPEMQTSGAIPPWQGFNAVEQTAWVREILTGRFLAERVVKAIGPTVLYPQRAQKDRWFFSSLWDAETAAPAGEELVLAEAVTTFLKNVRAEPAGRSSIIDLSFRHQDPELAARVVNLLGEMYLERHLGVQKNPKADTFFQEQLSLLRQKFTEAEQALLAFKQRNGITISVKQDLDLALKQQGDLRVELTETRSKQAEVASRDVELRQQLAHTSRTPLVVGQLREKLTALEIQEGELALRFTARNPALRSVRDQIEQLKTRIRALEGANLYGAESGQDSLYATLQAQLLRNAAEGKALRAREDILNGKLAELQARLNALEKAQTDFSHLEKRLQMDENNYQLYLTKFEESRISGAMDEEKIASVRVIEQAQRPLKPLDAKRNRKILLGILGSAIAALALPFLLRLLGGSLDTAEDVERSLALPVLASIPRVEAR